MRFPNPIGKRLEFVRKQYAGRPEVYETTAQIVAKTLGKGPAEIDPKTSVAWEKHIPWLAKHVNVLEKKKERGIPVAPEMRKLESGFRQSVEPFIKPRSGKKGARRVELAKLSPKQARKHYARTALTAFEKKQAQAREAGGYKIVKNLGQGYIAVQAVVDRSPKVRDEFEKLPKFRSTGGEPRFSLSSKKPEAVAWVDRYAKFQQWLGVTMKNCLQLYKVNYIAYGAVRFFDVLHKGGNLYAILDPKGKPVVAILTNAKGQVIETNGPNNQPAPESAAPYIEKLEKAMGWPRGVGGTFVAPPGFDTKLTSAINGVMDSTFFTQNLRERRYFIRKTQGYARQAGADFSKVWPKYAIYILEGSKYSALNSAKRSKYPERRKAIEAICRVVRLYKKGGTKSEFSAAAINAAAVKRAVIAAAKAEGGERWEMLVATATSEAVEAPYRVAMTEGEAIWATAAGPSAAGAVWAVEAEEGASAEVAERAENMAIHDYAKKLLELMRAAAQQAGRNLAANPKRKTAKRKVSKKNTVRKTTPEWQRLIRRCQKLWDHYCERPGKKRLQAILDHLEKMKTSTSAKVATERRRCLRSANLEAKRLRLN